MCTWFDLHGVQILGKKLRSWQVFIKRPQHQSSCTNSFSVQRKIKFPTEFDATDLVTDELKAKILPVSRKLKEVEKERAERRKVRKRTKNVASTSSAPAGADVEMADSSASAPAVASAATTEATATEGEAEKKETVGGELEDESVYNTKELADLEALVSPDLKRDIGCSVTGLYDLVGGFFSTLLSYVTCF